MNNNYTLLQLFIVFGHVSSTSVQIIHWHALHAIRTCVFYHMDYQTLNITEIKLRLLTWRSLLFRQNCTRLWSSKQPYEARFIVVGALGRSSCGVTYQEKSVDSTNISGTISVTGSGITSWWWGQNDLWNVFNQLTWLTAGDVTYQLLGFAKA